MSGACVVRLTSTRPGPKSVEQHMELGFEANRIIGLTNIEQHLFV